MYHFSPKTYKAVFKNVPLFSYMRGSLCFLEPHNLGTIESLKLLYADPIKRYYWESPHFAKN